MGAQLQNFYLYRFADPQQAPWLLRVIRPGANNADQTACDLADHLADAKAKTLILSLQKSFGINDKAELSHEWSSYFIENEPLESDLGIPLLKLFVALTEDRGEPVVMFAGESRADFAAWAEEWEYEVIHEKVEELEVKFFTELDCKLYDNPWFMTREMNWLYAEIGERNYFEAIDAQVFARELYDPRAPVGARLKPVVDLLESWLGHLIANGDWRLLAFELGELSKLEPVKAAHYFEMILKESEGLQKEWYWTQISEVMAYFMKRFPDQERVREWVREMMGEKRFGFLLEKYFEDREED